MNGSGNKKNTKPGSGCLDYRIVIIGVVGAFLSPLFVPYHERKYVLVDYPLAGIFSASFFLLVLLFAYLRRRSKD